MSRTPYLSGRRIRGLLAFASAFFVSLFVYPTAAASDPAASHLSVDAPDPEEIRLLEELAEWVDGGPSEQPIRRTIQERPASFDAFRQFHGPSSRRTLLAEIPFGEVIRTSAARHGVDGLLVAAVIQAESHFDAAAVSPRGAVGLMQIMPTWVDEDLRDRLSEPSVNVEVGTRYLRSLIDRFGGDLELALAAYNAGPTNVRRFGGVPPFRETQNYVGRVLGVYVHHHRSLWQGGEHAHRLETVS